MSTLDQAMNYLADRTDIGTYKLYSASKAVSATTTTTIQTINLKPGNWLVVSFMDLNASLSGATYNHTVYGSTVRTTPNSGGGSMNVRVISVNSATNITIASYTSSACTVRSTVWTIKIGEKLS